VKVHNRMPVILAPKHYERWLTCEDTERPPIDLRRPFPPESMTAHEASRDVGNVRNNPNVEDIENSARNCRLTRSALPCRLPKGVSLMKAKL
jgi:putative SOS response-associated peptidase YedK